MLAEESDETGQRSLVAHHLRHAEERRLERGRTAGDECRRGLGEHGEGLSLHQTHLSDALDALIVGALDRGGTGQHKLVFGEAVHHLQHGGQIVFDFLSAAAGKQCHDGPPRQVMPLCERLRSLMIAIEEGHHLIGGGVAHIMDGIMVLLLKETHLERQDGEQMVYIALDVLDAVLLPRPNLRRDVVEHLGQPVLVHELGDVEIEARVVDQDHRVGSPLPDILLALRHVAEDGRQVEEHRDEAHIGHLAVVAHQGSSLGGHLVATEEAELGLAVGLCQFSHQVSGMQVATRLSHYQVVSHLFCRMLIRRSATTAWRRSCRSRSRRCVWV